MSWHRSWTWRFRCMRVGLRLDPRVWLLAGMMSGGVVLGALGVAIEVGPR